MKIKLIIIGISVLLSSCDCWVAVNGKVISSVTGKPISNAKIEMLDRNIFAKSDKNGNFNIGEITGFCYSPKIRVTYANHKPFQIEIESDSDSRNFKVKRESKLVDLEEPIYLDSNNKNTFIKSTWIEKYSLNFEIKSDSIIIYLDEINSKQEIESINKVKKVTNNDYY